MPVLPKLERTGIQRFRNQNYLKKSGMSLKRKQMTADNQFVLGSLKPLSAS